MGSRMSLASGIGGIIGGGNSGTGGPSGSSNGPLFAMSTLPLGTSNAPPPPRPIPAPTPTPTPPSAGLMALGIPQTPAPALATAAATPRRIVKPVSATSLRGKDVPTRVFKNPLDKYGSPSPPSKRLKTGHADNGSAGSREENVAMKKSPPMAKSSHILLRTSSWGAASPMSATQRLTQQPMAPRPPPVPTGFKRAFENSKEVFVIDDDDGNDDDGVVGGSSARNSAPPPAREAKPLVQPQQPALLSLSSAPPTLPPPPMHKPISTHAPHAIPVLYLPPSSLPPPLPSLPPIVLPSSASQPQKTRNLSPPSGQKLGQPTFTRFANVERRPYLQPSHRDYISRNYQKIQKVLGYASTTVVHVDFLPDEVQHMLETARRIVTDSTGTPCISKRNHTVPEKELKSILRKKGAKVLQDFVGAIDKKRLPGRLESDIYAFIADVQHRARASRPSGAPVALAFCRHDREAHFSHEAQMAHTAKLSTLLFGRELTGQRILASRMRQPINFPNEIRKLREDSLTVCNEWTNCAGDITTISWISDDAFICGTTTHMDDRNHQYNRQGNLALATLKTGQLTAYPDHRIVRRPQAGPGLATVQHSHDDPWLYTSVVSSDYSSVLNMAFTSSFDKTVKAWQVGQDGKMTSMGTWRHKGKVNFVVASTHEMGLVATAADVSEKAVRVYRFSNPHENGRITYKVLPCPRIFDSAGRAIIPDKWAYLPAAVRWGLSNDTSHLLLVGFSPRGLGLTTDDEDIPPDRRDSGELRLWDGRDGSAWQINGGRSRNVFEVAWHPTQACFIAATAPKLHNSDENVRIHVRTQIRVFRPAKTTDNCGRVYAEVQTLDCYADDINELALLPNSIGYMYVAAGATNGRTYVWDTSQGDNPVHILAHGKCLEEMAGERISTEDTGVKFVAWGQTADRLYTGSSDGVVKAWNIRTHRDSSASPFVRDLLQCQGPVSFGAFSPSKSKLAIGDASGRVTLLSVNDDLDRNDEDGDFLSETDDVEDDDDLTEPTANNGSMGEEYPTARQQHRQRYQKKTFKQHPPEITRHPTPPPPQAPAAPPILPIPLPPAQTGAPTASPTQSHTHDEDDGRALAKEFLASGQLVIVPDRTVGAVKGPNYAETNLYCLDFHYGRQPSAPLLAQYDRMQQANQPPARLAPSRQRPLKTERNNNNHHHHQQGVLAMHKLNLRKDLSLRDLSPETQSQLQTDDRGALQQLIDADEGNDDPCNFGFAYEEVPNDL